MLFSIFVVPPFSPTLKADRLTINSAGQFLAFDGPSSKREAIAAAKKLAPHASRVSVFASRGPLAPGKLVWSSHP